MLIFRRQPVVSYIDGDVHMRQPSIRNHSSVARKSDLAPNNRRRTVHRSMTFAVHNERKYLQKPLRHSNSRISDIIKSYNESQEAAGKRRDAKQTYAEAFVAPPAILPDFDKEQEASFLDEDWLLQKSLERAGISQPGSVSDSHVIF
jgi:hypothetical protein